MLKLQSGRETFNLEEIEAILKDQARITPVIIQNIVEMAAKDELYNNPQHPYTKALMSAIPIPDPTHKRNRVILTGDLPSPANPPSGCKFRTRCPHATEKCAQEAPEYRDIGGGHFVACHLRQPASSFSGRVS